MTGIGELYPTLPVPELPPPLLLRRRTAPVARFAGAALHVAAGEMGLEARRQRLQPARCEGQEIGARYGVGERGEGECRRKRGEGGREGKGGVLKGGEVVLVMTWSCSSRAES